MSRPTQIQVDFKALQHNLLLVKILAPDCSVISMIKANGYGHGLVWSAKALSQTDAYGVACLEEAFMIRQAGLKNNIVLMSGFFKENELSVITYLNCDVVIHTREQIDILERAYLSKPIKIWIKINTGMNRLGFFPHEFDEIYERLHCNPNIRKPIHFMTHFAISDQKDNVINQQQLDLFYTTIKNLPGDISIANSGAILSMPKTRVGWVRPGILLYGVSPFADKVGADFGLKPAMRFTSEIMAIRQQKKGDTIGYCASYVCPEDMPIGVVPVGYGDCYPRHAKSGTPILVNGCLCPLIGRVSMDMITIDLRLCLHAKVGNKVLLWGKELPVEKVAISADTIPYELLSKISRRVFKKEKNLWEQ